MSLNTKRNGIVKFYHRLPIQSFFNAMTGRNSNDEKNEDELQHLRLHSSWFQWFRITMNFSFIFRETPFSLNFESGRYIVKTSTKGKWIWGFFHIWGAVVFWTEMGALIENVKSSHQHGQYFELLVSLGWLMFDYPIMYIWLCRLNLIQEFLDEIQHSKILLRHSSMKKPSITIAYVVGVTWYLITTFAFYPTRWGVFDWSIENYIKTLESACELHLGISKSNATEVWYPAAILFTFILTSFQYNALLCGDMLAFAAVLTMKDIAVDVDRAIRKGDLSDKEVFELLWAHKKLTKVFNRAFGLLVCVYVVYALPYYAFHGIDMIEIPGIVNQLSMPTYVAPLVMACKWAVDILILAKRRKRWLAANKRCLALERSKLLVMLDDITWEKYGVGNYYTVNSFVIGQLFSLTAMSAIVRIQSKNS